MDTQVSRLVSEIMIKDLLWACVVCGTEGGIRAIGRRESCVACKARYKRGRGASIVVIRPEGDSEVRNAREWLESLPPISLTGEALADVRMAVSDTVLRDGRKYLGRIEHFGPIVRGKLKLTAERVTFEPLFGDGGFDLPLEDLTAVQPSSAALQLKARHRPVIVVKFPTSSAKLWEERLQHSLRGCYARLQRGEIVEYQPRIATL